MQDVLDNNFNAICVPIPAITLGSLEGIHHIKIQANHNPVQSSQSSAVISILILPSHPCLCSFTSVIICYTFLAFPCESQSSLQNLQFIITDFSLEIHNI